MTLPTRHLTRRFMTSLSPRTPDPEDAAWVAGWLTQTELELWSTLSPADQRHSIEVARRFATSLSSAGSRHRGVRGGTRAHRAARARGWAAR